MNCLLLALFPAVLFAPGLGSKGDGERIANLLGKKPKQVEVLQDLKPAAAAELVARSGVSSDVIPELRGYAVQVEGDLARWKLGFVDASWKGKPVRVGAALNGDGVLQKLGAFDEFGKPLAEVDPFLVQFRGPYGVVLTAASNQPMGDAIQLRDKVLAATSPPPKPDEKKKWTLLRHRLLMRELGDRYDALNTAREQKEGVAPAARAVAEQLAAVDEFATHLKAILKPKDVGEYKKLGAAVAEGAAKVEQAALAGDAALADKLVKTEVKLGCGKCHGWDANAWKKPLEGAFRAERESAGLIDGAFVVDLDVKRAGLDPEDAQAMASAVKAALLRAKG